MIVRVHLITGEVVEGSDNVVTDETAIEEFDEFICSLLQSTPKEGWEIDLGMPGGGKAYFPKSSVLYIERVSPSNEH